MLSQRSRVSTEQRPNRPLAHTVAGLTWVLPLATSVFVLYVAGAFTGGLVFGLPLWVLLLPSLPSLLITWIALVVALVDATSRPADQLSDSARLAWLLALAVLNVLAFLPYWIVVARRPVRATHS